MAVRLLSVAGRHFAATHPGGWLDGTEGTACNSETRYRPSNAAIRQALRLSANQVEMAVRALPREPEEVG
jgi:hypothetical protein